MQQLNVTMSTLLSSHKTDALHARDITLWAVIGGQCNTMSGLTRAHIPCTSVAGGKCQCTPWSTRWTHGLTQRANFFGGQALAGALATLVQRCLLFHNCKIYSNLQNVRPAQLLQTM